MIKYGFSRSFNELSLNIKEDQSICITCYVKLQNLSKMKPVDFVDFVFRAVTVHPNPKIYLCNFSLFLHMLLMTFAMNAISY